MHLEIQVKLEKKHGYTLPVLNQLVACLWSEVILFIMNALKNRASRARLHLFQTAAQSESNWNRRSVEQVQLKA